MWAGFSSSSVIERKLPQGVAKGILFYRTRNGARVQSVPTVPPPPLPYGGETERANQCAMLVDFITNYTG